MSVLSRVFECARDLSLTVDIKKDAEASSGELDVCFTVGSGAASAGAGARPTGGTAHA
jgi:hypothetical protein